MCSVNSKETGQNGSNLFKRTEENHGNLYHDNSDILRENSNLVSPEGSQLRCRLS
jgi:hypothetical protein